MTIDFYDIVNNIIYRTHAEETNKKEVIEYMKQQIERGEYIQPTEVCDILGVQRRHNRFELLPIVRLCFGYIPGIFYKEVYFQISFLIYAISIEYKPQQSKP